MRPEKRARYDRLWMEIAGTMADMSYARRLKVGCVIVRGGRILSTGWNGMPAGFDNECEVVEDDGSLTTRPEVLHAEQNAILKLAQSTDSSDGATMYTTHSPCIECAKMINSSGVSRLVYEREYRCNEGVRFLGRYTIDVEQIDPHTDHHARL